MKYRYELLPQIEAGMNLLSVNTDGTHFVESGRTSAQAERDGEHYRISGHGIIDLSFPAARTLKALALCLNANGFVIAGETYRVDRIVKTHTNGVKDVESFGEIEIVELGAAR